jgi:hypothetical protein
MGEMRRKRPFAVRRAALHDNIDGRLAGPPDFRRIPAQPRAKGVESEKILQ